VFNEVNERLEKAYKDVLKYIPRADAVKVVKKYASLLKSKNEICQSNETGLKCEAVKNELYDEFEQYYADILRKILEYSATTIAQEYDSWLISKDKFCSKYSDDEIKLKSCHIDYSIPKLNEFWDMESILSKHPFEGKWANCGYDKNKFICVTHFKIEQGSNVCSGEYSTNPEYIRLDKKSANYLYPVKSCRAEHSSCHIHENGYDKQGRKIYQTSIPFSNWKDDDGGGARWRQIFHEGHSFFTYVKTPFFLNEREELIQTNKWLQDCLNYKQ
jgi:hypothetical protein